MNSNRVRFFYEILMPHQKKSHAMDVWCLLIDKFASLFYWKTPVRHSCGPEEQKRKENKDAHS